MPVQSVEKLNVVKLKEAIKAYNALPFVKEKVKSAGVTKEAMRDGFLNAIEALQEEFLEKLPGIVALTYNEVAGTEADGDEGATQKPAGEEKTTPEPKGEKKLEEDVKTPPKTEPAPEPKQTNGRAKKTPTVPGKKRTLIYNSIVRSGNFTRKEIKEKMIEEFGGSENEAYFITNIFTKLLVDMGFAEIKDGKVCLGK